MDPFIAVLIAGNMLALVLVVVRLIEECLGKQAGEQKDGDDDLKEVICQVSSRSLGSSSSDSSQGSQSTASSRKSSNSSSLSSDSSATSTKVEISRGALDEIAAFERFIEDFWYTKKAEEKKDEEAEAKDEVGIEECRGKQAGKQEGSDDDLKEVICVT